MVICDKGLTGVLIDIIYYNKFMKIENRVLKTDFT